MAKIIYAAQDGELAARIEQDVQVLDEDTSKVSVVILSPRAVDDSTIQIAIANVLDRGQRVIPVMAAPTPLPQLIEHIAPVDFSEGYHFEALRARLIDAGTPIKVRTPNVRTANRRIVYVLVALAVLWFLIALIFVGGGVIRRPDDEYNAVETEIILTRNYYVDSNLPHTTQEAAEFPSTIQAVPTALRPILSATATAVAGS